MRGKCLSPGVQKGRLLSWKVSQGTPPELLAQGPLLVFRHNGNKLKSMDYVRRVKPFSGYCSRSSASTCEFTWIIPSGLTRTRASRRLAIPPSRCQIPPAETRACSNTSLMYVCATSCSLRLFNSLAWPRSSRSRSWGVGDRKIGFLNVFTALNKMWNCQTDPTVLIPSVKALCRRYKRSFCARRGIGFQRQ